ncbi:MAG: filamentous hemagglutinin N-terminal domain-containing protein [Hormoscilla sp.]
MMKTAKSPNSKAPKLSQTGLLLGLLALVPTTFLPMQARAQISSDGTLSTSVTTNGNSFTINGGDRAGGNLFHSFSEFSVPTGGEAFFNNDLDVENIFSRVTGGNISNIDGLIRANGSANLFLLNPAGIVFGPNARLNIGGSFLGSSASSLMFPGGTEFSATDTQSTPLLTINAPIGLWFRGNEGNIVNRSAVNDVGLQVQPGRSLGLVGGNVSLDGGMIAAPGGRVDLGGLAALGTVGLNDDGSLSFPDAVARGNVSFANAAFVDVRAGGGGTIAVNARDMEMLGGSRLWAGIGEDMGTAGSNAGDVKLNATESIIVSESSNIQNRVFNTGSMGNSGDINVKAGSLLLSDGGFFSASTFGRGDAGNINVDVSGPVNLTGVADDGETSRFASVVTEGAVGNGGEIKINAGSVSLSNGALLTTQVFGAFEGLDAGQGNAGDITISTGSLSLNGESTLVTASTFGQGNAGNVIIEADGNVSLEGGNIFSNVETGAVGDSGNIEIRAGVLSLINGVQVQTAVNGISESNPELPGGRGNAGQIMIDVRGAVEIMGEGTDGFPSGIFSNLGEGAVGSGGSIEIEARSVEVSNGAVLSTGTSGEGDGGSVRISADGEVRLSDESLIASSVGEEGVGTGGNIEIAGEAVSLSDGARLFTSTFGEGDAGNVIISADGEVRLSDESSISSSVGEGGVGTGGNIEIAGRSVSLSNGALLNTGTSGEGDAGNVIISADGEVRLSDESLIASSVGEGGVGTGGNVEIAGRSVSLSNGAALSTGTLGEGDAGEVRLNASEEVTLEDALILNLVVTGAVGNGGSIEITGRSVSLSDGATLSSDTSGEGDAGEVRVNASEEVTLEDVIILSTVATGAVGNGGSIEITGRSVSLRNGGLVSTSTLGEGDPGNVRIDASGEVRLSDEISISSSVGIGAVGTGGSIDITARSLSLTNGAIVNTSTFGEGDAGSVVISANGEVMLEGEGGGIISAVSQEAVGNGGSIEIKARSLSLTNGGLVSTSTLGEGDAGSIKIDASGEVMLEGGFITSGLEGEAVGTGGSIDITGRSLSLTNGALVSTGTSGEGDAGSVRIDASEEVTLEDGFIFSTVERGGVGNGGSIDITGRSVSLSNGAQLSTSTEGEGDAGNVRIDASGEVRLSDESSISSSSVSLADGAEVTLSSAGTGSAGNLIVNASEISLNNGTLDARTASGNQGNITLNASENIQLRNSSAINTNAVGTATGGNISIDTDFLIAFPGNSDITANAIQGDGGRISITAEGILGIAQRDSQTPENDITVTSTFGSSGEVIFNLPDVDALRGIEELSDNAIDPEEAVAQACRTDSEDDSSFTVIGRGGLPRGPQDPLVSDNMEVGGARSSQAAPNKPPIVRLVEDTEPISSEDIVLARGWIVNEDGVVELTAYPTPLTGDRPFPTPVRCPGKK